MGWADNSVFIGNLFGRGWPRFRRGTAPRRAESFGAGFTF